MHSKTQKCTGVQEFALVSPNQDEIMTHEEVKVLFQVPLLQYHNCPVVLETSFCWPWLMHLDL